jgi:hypothetical protein
VRLRKSKSLAEIAAYAEDVATIVGDELGWDETTRTVFLSNYEKNTFGNGIPPYFEFIADEPISARFRLKPNPDVGAWALRLSFYPVVRTPPDHPDEVRARSVTDRLADAYRGIT